MSEILISNKVVKGNKQVISKEDIQKILSVFPNITVEETMELIKKIRGK